MTKKLIGIQEFLALSEDLQMQLLYRDGAYVGKRSQGQQTVLLMQLYSFYVEIYYAAYRSKIDRIVVSDTVEILQPYLDQVNVKELMKRL